MKIFDFFNRKYKKTSSPKFIISEVIEIIPDIYRDKQQYIDSIEFLKYNEWELALDSLIDLADDSKQYFSCDFWSQLANAADKMNLTERAKYCRKEMEEIHTKVGRDICKGSMVSKTDINDS